MLNRLQLKAYRELRGVSAYEVASNCNISQPMICMIENGTRSITKNNHDEIVKGINAAYQKRKADGTAGAIRRKGQHDFNKPVKTRAKIEKDNETEPKVAEKEENKPKRTRKKRNIEN